MAEQSSAPSQSSIETKSFEKFRTASERVQKPSMKDIDNYVVVRWASKWKEIATQLNIEEYLIRNIEHDYSSNCVECCHKMLGDWLEQNKHPTWEKLINALNQVSENLAGVSVNSTSSILRGQYTYSRFSVEGDDWPPYQPKHYTTLTLIHYKEKYTSKKVISFSKELASKGRLIKQREVHSNLTQHNDECETRQHSNTMKNISELFASSDTEHSANILLIEGAPGIGKTILSKEIAYQWANNNLLQYRKLLFLVYLRNVDSSKLNSVDTFVQHVLKSKEAAAGFGKYLTENNGKDLTVVLDGYDELSETDRKNSFIADLIKRRVLWKCLLVITSRPSASLPLHDIADCRVEVVGFTEEDRLNYINSALPDSPEKVAALQDYLQSNSTINALCYIPLNMTILLCLSENGIGHLPKTQTEIYRKFIEMTVIRFLEKTSENIFDAAVFNLNSLPHPHDVVFKELSRFAYEALKCDKLAFKLTEIQEICPSLTAVSTNWNGLGLLNSFTCIEDGSKIVTYHFLHFSIQEYMAAYHISTLPERKQLKLLKNSFWSAYHYNTWIMYVGITGGDIFPLKHFLSGNLLQIFTQLFKTGISKKILRNKIKCLHIFQCLAEAQNSDLLPSFGKLFQNQEIDLSKQTLLPRDLNTLGFFLVRSINKHWKRLDLSGCNMGSAGLKILFERFVDKDTHSVVTIDRADLSYNQLTFSSFVKLLNLVKTWKMSEFISVDDFAFDNDTACTIFNAVEHVVLQSSDEVILKTLLIGSFLFAYKLNENEMLELLAKAKRIKTMYLISCRWKLNVSEITSLLREQKFTNVHIIGSCLNSEFLRAVSSTISQCNNNFSLIIDDPTLSDQVADEIIGILPNNISNGIILVVSNSKIQGVINTCSLSSELSNLEMLNFIRRIRTLCSSCVPVVTSWNETLQWHGYISEGTIETFVNVLLSYKNANKFQLKIGLVEKHTLIGHTLKYEEINEILSNQFLTSIYLNSCDISSIKWNDIIVNYSSIPSLCLNILNCQIELFSILSLKRFMLRELFVHSTGNITSDDVEFILCVCHHSSVVVITKDTLGARNPTSKQLAMAHKLEPSVNIWKFFGNLNAVTCKQIAILLTSSKVLNELEFVGCHIGNIEIEILSDHLIAERHALTIQKLHISSSRITSSITSAFADIISISNVIVDDSKYPFCDSVIKILQNVSTLSELHIWLNNVTGKMVYDIAAVILNNKSLRIFDLGQSNIQATGIAIITKALQNVFFLSELSINNTNITEEAADDIAAVILNNRKLQILNISGNKFQTAGMIKIAKALQNISSLSELNIGWNNITEEAADDIAAVILNNTKLHLLNLRCNDFKSAGMIKIAKTLQNVTSLTRLDINNNLITEEAADDIAAVILNNSKLQVLDLGVNSFKTVGMTKLAKALQNVSSLTGLYINENNITEKAADDIAAVILNNSRLQILDISGNKFRTAIGMEKIAKALQNISSLSELNIRWSSITEKVANDIAAVILNNSKLQILNIGGNKFQTVGIIKIAKALTNISSLSELNIRQNNITEEAADNIAAVILNNSKLQVVNLCCNDFKAAGMIKIAKALQNVASLTQLYISNNNITEEAADDIAAVILNNNNLQVLDLGVNDLKAAGMIKVAKALQNVTSLTQLYINKNNITHEAADDIAAIVRNNSNLFTLDLCNNKLQVTGAIKIAQEVQNMPSCMRICIQNNEIYKEASDEIAAILSSNVNLYM